MQLIHNLYWQPTPACPLTSQLPDHHISHLISWVTCSNCCWVVVLILLKRSLLWAVIKSKYDAGIFPFASVCNMVNNNYYGSTQRVTRDYVSYGNLRILPAVFVAISERGLCPIDIQQSLSWTLVNSGRFLGGQRREVTRKHMRA